MRPERFLEIIGNIDDELVQEADINGDVNTGAPGISGRRPRVPWVVYAGIAAGIAVVAGIVLLIYSIESRHEAVVTTPAITWLDETNGPPIENLEPTGASPSEFSPTGAGPSELSPTGAELEDVAGCGGQGEIPAELFCIVIRGQEYWVSDEEGYAFICENYESIRSSLMVSGVDAENLVVEDHGHSHFCTEDNTVAANFRDYLCYNDGELVAIATIVRDETGMVYYLAFEAPWFDDYSEFLADHRGEELVYMYVGYSEAVITPDNRIFFTCSMEEYTDYQEGVDYYHMMNQGINTYTP